MSGKVRRMAKFHVLGGSFGKREATLGEGGEITFWGEKEVCVLAEHVVRTIFADERAMLRPDIPEPGQVRAVYKEARETGLAPANLEVLVIFTRDRWAYIRADKTRDAKRLHTKPDD